MSGSYEFIAGKKLSQDSSRASTDAKHDAPIAPAITSGKSGHKHALPPLLYDTSDSWPPNLWSANNTATSIPSTSQKRPAGSVKYASDLQKRNLHSATEQYKTFIPRIKQANSGNFGAILVDVVKETAQASLDDFFRLIYTPQPSSSIPITLDHHSLSLQFSTIEANSPGLALCRLIHDTFMNPLFVSTYFGVDTQKASATNVNPHEFHRIFLATKILFNCVKEVDGPHKNKATLVKTSIFNMYQVCILRLLEVNFSNIDRESFPESLIIGQAGIGRLMRMIFTSAESKRLGKRGYSKYHFTGVAWRETALDEDISHLIQLEPSQVKRHYESVIQKAHNKPVAPMKTPRTHFPKPDSIIQPEKTLQPQGFHVPTPFLSYVKSSSRFPAVDFSPRVKAICPRRVPKQPQWLREVMNRSIKALEQYKVYLRQPIEEFQAGDYGLGTQNSYYRLTVCAEKTFHENCWDDAYLHLHIIILSSFFPAVLASDEEISPASKILIRASMRNLIKELEQRESERSPFEKTHRRIFTGNLKKLVNISETNSVVLSKELATNILQAVVEDLADLAMKEISPGEGTALENIYAKSAIAMFNAHSHIFPPGKNYKDLLISRIVKISQEMRTEVIMRLRCMLEEAKLGKSKTQVEGLPFEIIKVYIEACHKWLLHNEFFLEIPIPVMKFFFTKLHGEIQSVNFQAFGKRRPQIATEIFKNWWLITSSIHESFTIMSELVALSQHFD